MSHHQWSLSSTACILVGRAFPPNTFVVCFSAVSGHSHALPVLSGFQHTLRIYVQYRLVWLTESTPSKQKLVVVGTSLVQDKQITCLDCECWTSRLHRLLIYCLSLFFWPPVTVIRTWCVGLNRTWSNYFIYRMHYQHVLLIPKSYHLLNYTQHPKMQSGHR